jgi:PGF-pre-PGF domain-containing protein
MMSNSMGRGWPARALWVCLVVLSTATAPALGAFGPVDGTDRAASVAPSDAGTQAPGSVAPGTDGTAAVEEGDAGIDRGAAVEEGDAGGDRGAAVGKGDAAPAGGARLGVETGLEGGSAGRDAIQASDLVASADRVTFGPVPVVDPGLGSNLGVLAVRNEGDAPISIDRATIEGADAAAFEIRFGGGPATLAPGESRQIVVAFAPTAGGTASARLRVEAAAGGSVTVDLVGAALAPDIEVQPETIRFANATDGPVTEALTLTNDGDAPLTVRAIRIVGPDRAVFEQPVDDPFALLPGGSLTVPVSSSATAAERRFATVHVVSDDPDEPQRNVWLTNTPMVADVSPSTVLPNRTVVNATVTNAQANAAQTINVSWPLTRDDAVAVDAIEFTPDRRADFTINVTKSSERFGDAPPFDLEDGTRSAAFISMNSTLSDEALRNVSVVFRVRKDQLTGNETGPEDVSLYTRRDGRWVELPTRLVDENPTHYFFEAQASGLADFATGVKRAKFRIDDAIVGVTEIRTGESVEVLVRVTNVGGADGTYVVKLIRGDAVVDRRELSIAPLGTRQTIFTESFGESGTYELYVNDRFAGTVTVS